MVRTLLKKKGFTTWYNRGIQLAEANTFNPQIDSFATDKLPVVFYTPSCISNVQPCAAVRQVIIFLVVFSKLGFVCGMAIFKYKA